MRERSNHQSKAALPRPTLPGKAAVSAEAGDYLDKLVLKIDMPQIQDAIWNRHLTAKERAKILKKGNSRTLGITQAWMEVHRVSFWRAIVEMSYACGSFGVGNYEWLLRELGEVKSASSAKDEAPEWNPDSRELRFGGMVVRTIRSKFVGHRIVAILEAFQNAGWPKRVDAPEGFDDQIRRESIASLNERLDPKLRFLADGSGGICWEERPPGIIARRGSQAMAKPSLVKRRR